MRWEACVTAFSRYTSDDMHKLGWTVYLLLLGEFYTVQAEPGLNPNLFQLYNLNLMRQEARIAMFSFYKQMGYSKKAITTRWVLLCLGWTLTYSQPVFVIESESDETRRACCHILGIWPFYEQMGHSRKAITLRWVLLHLCWTLTYS